MTYETVEIFLDSVKKHRNAEEYRYVNRATCPKYKLESSGDHNVLLSVMKELKETFPEKDFMLNIKRGEQLVFVPCTLSSWFVKKEQPAGLKNHVKLSEILKTCGKRV